MKKGTRNNIILWSTILFVVLLFALSMFMSDETPSTEIPPIAIKPIETTTKTPRQKPTAEESQAKAEAQARAKSELKRKAKTEAIAWMNEGISKGIFSHVNEHKFTVRMDQFVWISLSLEAKQGLLRGCATYFKIRTGLYDATIFSNRNDNKLADYSFLGAERIHY